MNVDEKILNHIGYKVSQYLFLLLYNLEEVFFIRNNPDKAIFDSDFSDDQAYEQSNFGRKGR